MKRTLITIAGCLAGLAFSVNSYAQQAGLVQDQNPRYEETRAKYMNMADSLTSTQGTTVQQTYKAYDWYEAREERRKLRRERSYDYNSYNYGYGFGYGYPTYYGNSYFYPSLNIGWGSRHGNYWGRHGYGFGW